MLKYLHNVIIQMLSFEYKYSKDKTTYDHVFMACIHSRKNRDLDDNIKCHRH